MGIFDLFTKKTEQAGPAKRKGPSPRELARLDRLVSDKLAQNYDRQDAIAALGQMANAEGARALLRRFDFSMQPSITDQEEKEAARLAAEKTAAENDPNVKPASANVDAQQKPASEVKSAAVGHSVSGERMNSHSRAPAGGSHRSVVHPLEPR